MLTLHKALERDPPGTVIKTLLQAFPDAIFLKDSNGMLPIHHSAKSGKKCALGFAIILQAFPAGIKVRDNEGRLPIHFACEHDAHEGIVDMLIDEYPQSLYVEDQHGCTPLDFLKTRDAYEIKTPLKKNAKLIKSEQDALMNDMEKISEQVLEVIPSENASKRQIDILRRLASKKDGRTRNSFSESSSRSKNRHQNQQADASFISDDVGSYLVFDMSSVNDFNKRLSWESSTIRSAMASIPEWSIIDSENGKQDNIFLHEHEVTVMEDGLATNFGTHRPTTTSLRGNLRRDLKTYQNLVTGFDFGLTSSFVLIAGLCGGGQLTVSQIFVIGLASAWGAAISLGVKEFFFSSYKNIEFTNHYHDDVDGDKGENDKCNFTTLEEESDITRTLDVIGITDENMRAQLRGHHSYNNLDDSKSKHGQTSKQRKLEQNDSSLHDAFSSGATFITGSMLPILPFVFVSTHMKGLIYSAVMLCASVFICKLLCIANRTNFSAPRSTNRFGPLAIYTMQRIIIAGTGGIVAYFVGNMLTKLLL